MSTATRWGIIGTGSIAHGFATDLQLTDEAVVVAVGSRAQSSADAFADEFDIPHRHDSYEDLVEDSDVDVVYVGTPHPMHYANALLALEHNKPALVEKAFTVTAAEARELVAVARAKSLFLMEGMWTRFLPHVVAVREVVETGVLGDIVQVISDYGQWFAEDPTARLYAPELGGGALLDLGVYPISFASMVLGPPSRVLAMISPAFTGVDGQTSMLFGYESGAQAILTCTLSALSEGRASIVGSDARIDIDGDAYEASAFTLTSRSGHSKRYEFPHEGGGLRHQALEVGRCLAAGLTESPIMPLDETVSVIETMERVLQFQ